MDEFTTSEIGSLRFPFLGSLEDGDPFQYVLLTIHSGSVEIAIFDWLVNRSKMQEGSKVDLYIPEYLSEQNRFSRKASEVVLSSHYSKEMQGEIYKVSLSKEEGQEDEVDRSFDAYAQQMPVKTHSLSELLIYLIKDSLILKQGVRVYLKHLIPYFSRIVNHSYNEYVKIKEYFLLDVDQRIANKEAKLEKLYLLTKEKISNLDQIPIYIDLEELRETLESEISFTLFNIVFADQNPNIDEFRSQTGFGINMYISAIKNIEKRLYSNYNHIVMIYLKSLG